MAAGKGDSKSAPTKRGLRDVISTPGKSTSSPMRKQLRKAIEEGSNDEVNSSDSLKSEIADVISAVLDTKLEGLVTRIESMMTAKIQELEAKFESIQSEVKQLKQEVNESINHVEDVLKYDIDQVWEYAVKNEHYSRKNNLRILGLDEEEGENLEQKFVEFVKENLQEELRPEEIEIIPRIGKKNNNDGDQGSRRERKRAVIVKLQSNKTKMKILLKRRLLKGKEFVIMEDMADDIARRLRVLKSKKSVESAWFSNGKLKYKQHRDPRVQEIRGWSDLGNLE